MLGRTKINVQSLAKLQRFRSQPTAAASLPRSKALRAFSCSVVSGRIPEIRLGDRTTPKISLPGKRVFLSLGSNLGDRVGNIRKALEQLAEAGIAIKRVSSFYRTEPVDFRPQAWFVNCVAEAETRLMPLQLLKAVKLVERALGRRPTLAKRPRAIDIDILLYENVVVHSAALNIPHPHMAERRFVLLPLRELAGNLRHPVSKRTVYEMLAEAGDTSQVVRLNDTGLR